MVESKSGLALAFDPLAPSRSPPHRGHWHAEAWCQPAGGRGNIGPCFRLSRRCSRHLSAAYLRCREASGAGGVGRACHGHCRGQEGWQSSSHAGKAVMDEPALFKLGAQLDLIARCNDRLENCTDPQKRAILTAIRALAEAGAPAEEIFRYAIFLMRVGKARDVAQLL